MKGDALNPDHSFVAYASGSKIDNGAADGEVFMRRAGDSDSLSSELPRRFLQLPRQSDSRN